MHFFGIIGGAVIAQIMLGISFTQFLTEAQQILTPMQFLLGLIKSFIYGFPLHLPDAFMEFIAANPPQQ